MRGESFIIPGERLSRFMGLAPGNTEDTGKNRLPPVCRSETGGYES